MNDGKQKKIFFFFNKMKRFFGVGLPQQVHISSGRNPNLDRIEIK